MPSGKIAEIGKFVDTPVKRYSSDVRAPCVAHLEPEILIVEVLAVGDADLKMS